MSAATILTLANGRGIDLLAPLASDIDFESYSEQLAKEKRYNGATPDAEYSVAEHMCRGADAILQGGEYSAQGVAAYFLLHDVHEAVLKDLTTPLKRTLADLAAERFGVLAEQITDSFRLLEYRHDVVIHEAAGLVWPPIPQIKHRIKHWDLVMFVTEWRDLMGDRPHPNWVPYSGIKPLPDKINPWRWQTAKAGLLTRWRVLLPSLNARAA
jgi:hypothetical protein